MPLYHEGYRDQEKAKTARMIRYLTQAVGRNFKGKIIRPLYPTKIIKDIDIGAVCTAWTYYCLTFFSDNKEILQILMGQIYTAYKHNKNLATSERWRRYIIYEILPEFAKKTSVFTNLSQLALMDDLEEKKKKSSGYGNVRW